MALTKVKGAVLEPLTVNGTVTSDGADLDGAVTINEGGADVDFRVESNNNEHALFVQGSDGYVGINESTPLANLHVKQGASGVPTLGGGADTLLIESNTPAGLTIASPNTTANAICFGDNNSSVAGIIEYSHPTDTMTLYTNTVSRLELNATETAFNEGGNDVDFRVESDTNTHALFVQGSDGNVGIGTGQVGGGALTVRRDNAASDLLIKTFNSTPGTYNRAMLSFELSSSASATRDYDILAEDPSNNGGYLNIEYEGSPRITIANNDSVIFNQDGQAIDFRVESANNANMLFVDGSADAIGINESSPDTLLHISNGSAGSAYPLTTYGNNLALESNTSAGLHFVTPNTGSAFILFSDSDSPNGSRIEYRHAGQRFNLLTESQMRLSVMNHVFLINEGNAGMDFVVRSMNDNAMLQVDSSADAVGIGIAAPLAERLHIYNGASGRSSFNAGADDLIIESDSDVGLTLATDAANTGSIIFSNQYGQSPGSIQYVHASNYTRMYTNFKEWIRATEAETVINEIGYDKDFRVESDTNTHALFVEGSNGNVGINTSAPGGPLEIGVTAGTSGPTSGLRLISEDGGGWALFPATAVANPTWTTNVNSGESHAWSAGGSAFTKMTLTNGLYMSGATGGDKGLGSINATAVYDDNTLLTDFVLDQAVDGEIDYEFYDNLELGGSAARDWDPRNLDIDHYEAQWRERKALPSFRSKAERFDDEGEEIRDSVGTLIQGLQQELETAMVHIAQLNARIKQLEEK